MKNFIIALLLTVTASLILQLFLPWYIVAVVAFAVAYFVKQNSFSAFASGFVAVFLLWVLYAYMLSSANENLLATKFATLLPLKGNVTLLLLITGIIGGLVSGFSALTGSLAGKIKA